MKANRKFLNKDDEAVSPVIAVILMVAITVVLAATVYVWVSGFSGGNQGAAASLSLSQGTAHSTTAGWMNFTVTSISPGFQVQNLKILDSTAGTVYAWNGATAYTVKTFRWMDDGSTVMATGSIGGAGDILRLHDVAGAIDSGDTLQFVDTNSNSVIASIVVR